MICWMTCLAWKEGYRPAIARTATMKILFLPGLLRQRWMPLPSVGKPRACGAPAGSTVRPDEAAVQTFDGDVLAWLHLERRVVGIARQQPDARKSVVWGKGVSVRLNL